MQKKLFFLFYFYVSSIMFFLMGTAFSPKISIITSLYGGDQFIKGFMHDITQQTIFDQSELIIINANSPGNEGVVIAEYMKKFPNIRYEKLDHDPGLYGVWNMAIRSACGEYITNANVDDRLRSDCYEKHAAALDKNRLVDLVYSDFYVTYHPNETFKRNHYNHVRVMPKFSQRAMVQSLPNNHPMWRKSFHEKYGLFNEKYRHAGDWEMWLRAVKMGATFFKVEGVYGLYYYNPEGLSTSKKNNRVATKEVREIFNTYKELFK